MAEADQTLLTTPLDGLHRELGARMVPFAGYAMPVQYQGGIIAEHQATRAGAGLFDVSHMGQVRIDGPDRVAALESLVPGDIAALADGKIRYTLFTNAQGGILDDLMVTNAGDHLFLVVNASRKQADLAHMRAAIGSRVRITELADRALLALQGPQAADLLATFDARVKAMAFMTAQSVSLGGIPCFVSRSGYTGEDGFEISVPADRAEELARALLAMPAVAPVGLGARDSLRLEAGLCLYGSDIDESTTPVQAGLTWTISKRRREAGGFPGDAIIQTELSEGAKRYRVGILPEGKAPARAHTEVTDQDGKPIGEVTSGGFGPSVGGPVAMGYVLAPYAKPDTPVNLMVRGVARPARIVPLPFVPHRYVK